MSLPPNRIGAIRGPGGATLDDVVAELGNLNAKMNTVITELQGARADTRSIWGEVLPAGWPGFGFYLDQRLAPVNPATAGVRQMEQLATLAQRLGWIGGTAAPNASTQGASLYAYLQRAIGPLTQVSPTGSGDVLDYLNQMTTDILRIYNQGEGATDDGAGTPIVNVYAEMRDLLAQLEACLCEGGGGGENPTNSPPVDLCESATRRAVSWDTNGTVTIGGVEHTIYRPRFDFSGGFFDPLTGIGNAVDGDPQAFSAGPNTAGVLCVTWDFTGNVRVPTSVGRNQTTVSSSALDTNVYDAPALPGGSTYTRGRLSANFDRCGDLPTQYAAWSFAFPTAGGTPTLNVFAGYVDVGCPS